VAVFPAISTINYDSIFNELCFLLKINPVIIKKFSKQDYYLYCLYFCNFFNKDFTENELVINTEVKLKKVPYNMMNNQKIISSTYNTYREYFIYCLKQLLYFERTLYDLLFTNYNILFMNNLTIIYHNESLKKFLLRERFFDLLYSFLIKIYNQYGQDYWTRAQQRSIDTFIYFIYFEPFFTSDQYQLLIDKMIRYYDKLIKNDINLDRIQLIKQYINDSTCPNEYKHEFNSKYLLRDL